VTHAVVNRSRFDRLQRPLPGPRKSRSAVVGASLLRALIRSATGAATVLLIAACGTTPATRYYALETIPTPASTTSTPRDGQATIAVRAVAVPAAADRPQIVVRAGDSRVSLDEFNRWAGPLRDEIARVVAGNLSAQLGAAVVTVSSAFPSTSDLVVLLDVQRFDAKPADGVVVDVVWIIRRAVDEAPGRSGRSVVREPAAGAGYEELVAAYNRALATVSRDIGAAVRAY